MSEDGKSYTFTLRNGLKFHDGQPVRAADATSSIVRWARGDPAGQKMMAAGMSLKAVDDKTFTMTFEKPFRQAIEIMAKPSWPLFVYPERNNDKPNNTANNDAIGSGPFKFVHSEWKPGSKIVFVKNPDYVPRSDPADGYAGGKVVKVDRVEWNIIPDANTAVSALKKGEVDIVESIPLDFAKSLRSDPNVTVAVFNKIGLQAYLRFNNVQPPFNNQKIRQALLHMVNQDDYMRAMIGDEQFWSKCWAYLMCGSRNGSEGGAEAYAKPDREKAKQLLKEAGYNGEKVVVLTSTGIFGIQDEGQVLVQELKSIGMNVEEIQLDFNTMLSRRLNSEGVEKGGWSIIPLWSFGPDLANPLTSQMLTAPCKVTGWPGWACSPKLESLVDEWALSQDDKARKAKADEIQKEAIGACCDNPARPVLSAGGVPEEPHRHLERTVSDHVEPGEEVAVRQDFAGGADGLRRPLPLGAIGASCDASRRAQPADRVPNPGGHRPRGGRPLLLDWRRRNGRPLGRVRLRQIRHGVLDPATSEGAAGEVHGRGAIRTARSPVAEEARLRAIRGNEISMIFQEPMTSLNPVLTIGRQIGETVRLHEGVSRREARARAAEMLAMVGIQDPAAANSRIPASTVRRDAAARDDRHRSRLPSEASHRRRADHFPRRDHSSPGSGPHPRSQEPPRIGRPPHHARFRRRRRNGRPRRHHVCRPQGGRGARRRDLRAPSPSLHAGAAAGSAAPRRGRRGRTRGAGLRRFPASSRRCSDRSRVARSPRDAPSQRNCAATSLPFSRERPTARRSPATTRIRSRHDEMPPLLEVRGLTKHFPVRRGFLGMRGHVAAVDGVDFVLGAGESLSIVGESGCGKSTLGRLVLRLLAPTGGEVLLRGRRIDKLSPSAMRPLRKDMQIVFQDPFGSLDPRMTVRSILAEPLVNFGLATASREIDERVADLLAKVRLPADAMRRFPHEFSGGQRQRIGIARALAPGASLIVCDEAVSALDVSVKAQIINLLSDLRDELAPRPAVHQP